MERNKQFLKIKTFWLKPFFSKFKHFKFFIKRPFKITYMNNMQNSMRLKYLGIKTLGKINFLVRKLK